MSKIVRRTDLQIIKDDLKELVLEPEEVNLLSFKRIFSRVKNIKHFKNAMDTLMDLVTGYIYELEEGALNAKQKYSLIIKAREICQVIKTKSKFKISGLTTNYKNKIHNFLVEDGNYFLKIKKKELEELEEQALLYYEPEDIQKLVYTEKKLEYFYEALEKSDMGLFLTATSNIGRLWKKYLKKQLNRQHSPLLVVIAKTEFHLKDFIDFRHYKNLDTDLRVRFFKDFSFGFGEQGELLFDAVGLKERALPELFIDRYNPDFIAKEKALEDDPSIKSYPHLRIRQIELEEEASSTLNS